MPSLASGHVSILPMECGLVYLHLVIGEVLSAVIYHPLRLAPIALAFEQVNSKIVIQQEGGRKADQQDERQ